jgi:penicillin-binding protein 1A
MDAPRERLVKTSDTAPRPARSARKLRRESRLLAFVRGVFAFAFIAGLAGACIATLIVWHIYNSYAADLPSLDGLRTYQPPVMSRVYAGDDRLMAELATERRIFVPFTAIPDRVKQAFIAAEDQNFYTHKGIDPFAIARAAYTDLQRIGGARRPVGASTITQQVARNMLLASNDLSFRRKIKEALLALRLERTLSKERILELYLNEIYLGQGSYGVAAAAQVYFNKPLDQLSVAEAAMLAALPKSPTNYNPFHFPEAARGRRDWVVDRMVETHGITTEQAAAARAEKLVPASYKRPEMVQGSDWFAGEVKRQLLERFGQDQAAEGGLIVHTSFDPAMQALADKSLRDGLMAYDHSRGGWRGVSGHVDTPVSLTGDWADVLLKRARPPGMLPEWRLGLVLEETASQAKIGWLSADAAAPAPHVGSLSLSELYWARPVTADGEPGAAPRRMADIMQRGDLVMVEPETGKRGADTLKLRQIPKVSGALVAMDPHTGRVLAMSGGWSAELSQFNRVTQAQRQPGSSFKPFVYLTAMEQGISPSARFLDAPFALGDWRPNNYEMDFGGPTPLHIALEKSLNLVTVRLAEHIGMDAVAKTAISYHVVDAMPRVLPAALGAVDTTVLREAGAYASIEEGGRVVLPSVIDSVQDRDGHVIWRAPGLTLGPGDPAQPPLIADPRLQVADPASTFQVLEMMQGVVKNGTGVAVGAGLDRPIAGKTGTSQDYNDGWFAGFTPNLVTIVWMGFDTPQTLGDKQDGAHTAGPIWHNFMKAALGDTPALDFRVPDGVTVDSWPCGPHDCIDAFKPDQEPGAAGVAGMDPVSGGGVQMDDADPGSQTATSGTPASAQAGSPTGSGTGVDSGVGGLY